MRNINRRKSQFLLQVFDQLDNLCLNSHVQGCGRLIADQDFRVAGQGDGNNNALPHTAGILEGIIVKAFGRVGDSNAFHNLDCLLLSVRFGKLLVLFNNLGNLGTDRPDRVQGRHGILENGGDLHAADTGPVLFLGQLCQILSMIHHRSVRDLTVGLQHAGKSFCKNGFAAAGLTDNCKGFSFIQVQ